MGVGDGGSGGRRPVARHARIFAAELVGTFVVVVCATGSVVLDAGMGGVLGVPFAALAAFGGVAAGVYMFGGTSMAHFNPAVTVGYYAAGFITRVQVAYYFAAEIAGAMLGSLFVMHVVGDGAGLGANVPGHGVFGVGEMFGAEVLATAMLMAVIFAVVHTRGLGGLGGVAIGGIVGIDILLFSHVSGASMNPARALSPALLSGTTGDLWLYWSATFVGAVITAAIVVLVVGRGRGPARAAARGRG